MIKKLFYGVAAVLAVTLAYALYDYFAFVNARNAVVAESGQKTSAALREQVDEILVKITEEGNRLAKLFGENDYSSATVEELIRESARSIPELQGVTACYEPDAFSNAQRLYCPYYNKGSQSYVRVEESYDYSKIGKGTAWYTTVRDEGAKWVEPYYAAAAKGWYVDYGIPFYYQEGPRKGDVRGTITMSFELSGFTQLIHSLSLGKTGYGLIATDKGTLLAHPISDYVGTKSLDTLRLKTEQPEMISAYQAMQEGQTGSVSYYDSVQKSETLFYFDKIKTSNWNIGLLFYKNDLLNDQLELNRRYIYLALLFSFFIVALLVVFYNMDYLDEGEIWRISIVSSCLLIANISLIVWLQHTTNTAVESEISPPIVDLSSLGNFVSQQQSRAETLKLQSATPVPTGIYLQNLDFQDSYNLNVGGVLWQKYPLSIADSVKVGFQFPQMSPFAEASYIEEAYRKTIQPREDVPGYLLVGWDFRVTLRLDFKYADYPLDKRHIKIKVAPLDLNDHLLFTPDLESYSYTSPSKKSGLHPAIRISGSEVLDSYFNYTVETYETDFGYGEKLLFGEVPSLHFNVHTRRLLLNAFVTYLIPIFVTLTIVFILMLACGKTNERQGIIESMAAFFFVLIFSHIDLRKEVVTADLIYMEYFYFLSYIMLVLATFNLIIFTKDKSKMFDFNDNQIAKASFFPVFLFLVLLVTLNSFY